MSPAGPRANKSLRLGQEELTRTQVLLELLHYASEAELLAEAARRGLLLLQAEAAGGDRALLAQRLRTLLLPAFDLLVEQDALPALMNAYRAAPPAARPEPPAPAPPAIAPTVAKDLASLGSGFLDDDDDLDEDLGETGYDLSLQRKD